MHRQSTPMMLCFALLLLLGTIHTHPAESAQCVNVNLHDSNGTIVPTKEPVIGIMLGGVPTIEGEFPEHATTSAGTEVPCPQELTDLITNLFTETCTTSERRTAAAQVHGVGPEIIQKGCTDLSNALETTD